jgi:hypothetical protein
MVVGEYRGSERGLHALTWADLSAMLKRCRERAKPKIKRERRVDNDVEHDDVVTITEVKDRKRRRVEDGEVITLN